MYYSIKKPSDSFSFAEKFNNLYYYLSNYFIILGWLSFFKILNYLIKLTESPYYELVIFLIFFIATI
jgi:hypothetical protein